MIIASSSVLSLIDRIIFKYLDPVIIFSSQINAAMTEAYAQRGWQGPRGVPPEGANMTLVELGLKLKVYLSGVRGWFTLVHTGMPEVCTRGWHTTYQLHMFHTLAGSHTSF